jgi:putative polyhydroxyalkanoate system protein
MSDITYSQAHSLGLPKARELAKQWSDQAAQKMGLSCKYQESGERDTLAFERSGVTGTIMVTGTSLDLDIKLGMMMKPFKAMIEGEVAKSLGRMIEKASGSQA